MDLKTLLNQRNMTIEKLSEKSGVPQRQWTKFIMVETL